MDGKKRQSVGSADLTSNLAHRALVNEGLAQPVVEAPKSPSSKGPKSPTSKAPKSPVQHQRKPLQTSGTDSMKMNPKEPGHKSSPKSGPAPTELPDFIIQRNDLFAKLKLEHDDEIKCKPRKDIKVIVDTGAEGEKSTIAKSWETTPGQLLKHVSKEVSANVVIAKVNGKELWDLDRPLESDCKVNYLPFDSKEGKEVFWHSSAHVLGEAAECEYGCLLSHGPPTLQGFFYDMALEEGYENPPQPLCS
jgi:threonyl-tRNA synthetase